MGCVQSQCSWLPESLMNAGSYCLFPDTVLGFDFLGNTFFSCQELKGVKYSGIVFKNFKVCA